MAWHSTIVKSGGKPTDGTHNLRMNKSNGTVAVHFHVIPLYLPFTLTWYVLCIHYVFELYVCAILIVLF